MEAPNQPEISPGKQFADFFALKRNLVIILVAIFVIGTGEELWMRFVPKYLQTLGASVFVIGLYDALRTLISAIYAYPGGLLVDRWGHRRAFITFNLVSIAGYALVLLIPHWGAVIAGMFLFLSWTCFSLPAAFSLVGASVAANRYSMGIGVQMVIKRVPIMVAPLVGGILIDRFGVIPGVRVALIISILLAGATFIALRELREEVKESEETVPMPERWNFLRCLREFDAPMRWLLVSDILVRFCERIPFAWVVIFAMDYAGASGEQVGLLTTIEVLVATICIIPSSHFADKQQREPFVVTTFVMFTLFPDCIAFLTELSRVNDRLLYSRTERVWRYLTQSSHRQLQRTGTTRPNDRRLLLDPRLDRECRSNSRSVPLESKSRGQFSRRGRIWHCRNNPLPQGNTPRTAKGAREYQIRYFPTASEIECFLTSDHGS